MPGLLRTITVAIACVMLVACSQKSVEFSQIFVGSNGPKAPHAYFFESGLALENSWVKSALTPSEYQLLLSKVNFEHEMLLAFAIGERAAFSGTIKFTRAYLYTGVESLPINVSALVGVIGEKCKDRSFISYPFTLVVLQKPEKFGLPGGYDMGNFDDGCKAGIAGVSNDAA